MKYDEKHCCITNITWRNEKPTALHTSKMPIGHVK